MNHFKVRIYLKYITYSTLNEKREKLYINYYIQLDEKKDKKKILIEFVAL
jgi:hypothetical protein